jgi:hypothetical protein
VLECKGADDATCLTKGQTQTARLIYVAGEPEDQARNHRLEPGSELGWTGQGWSHRPSTGLDQFRFLVFKDLTWASRNSTSRPTSCAEETDADTFNALIEPQAILRSRREADSVGWNDPQISPGNSVQH